MASTKLRTKVLKAPKQTKSKAVKTPQAAKRGGLAKGSLSADLRKTQQQAKPRAGKPLKNFT
jgi:hypothetical protein